jgi:hypothetical protein
MLPALTAAFFQDNSEDYAVSVIERLSEPHNTDELGLICLYAVQRSYWRAAKMLLSRGASPDRTLLFAAATDAVEVFHMVVDEIMTLGGVWARSAAVTEATHHKSMSVLRYLLTDGRLTNILAEGDRLGFRRQFIREAVSSGSLEVLHAVLAAIMANDESQSEVSLCTDSLNQHLHSRPLFIAASAGHSAITEYILSLVDDSYVRTTVFAEGRSLSLLFQLDPFAPERAADIAATARLLIGRLAPSDAFRLLVTRVLPWRASPLAQAAAALNVELTRVAVDFVVREVPRQAAAVAGRTLLELLSSRRTRERPPHGSTAEEACKAVLDLLLRVAADTSLAEVCADTGVARRLHTLLAQWRQLGDADVAAAARMEYFTEQSPSPVVALGFALLLSSTTASGPERHEAVSIIARRRADGALSVVPTAAVSLHGYVGEANWRVLRARAIFAEAERVAAQLPADASPLADAPLISTESLVVPGRVVDACPICCSTDLDCTLFCAGLRMPDDINDAQLLRRLLAACGTGSTGRSVLLADPERTQLLTSWCTIYKPNTLSVLLFEGGLYASRVYYSGLFQLPPLFASMSPLGRASVLASWSVIRAALAIRGEDELSDALRWIRMPPLAQRLFKDASEAAADNVLRWMLADSAAPRRASWGVTRALTRGAFVLCALRSVGPHGLVNPPQRVRACFDLALASTRRDADAQAPGTADTDLWRAFHDGEGQPLVSIACKEACSAPDTWHLLCLLLQEGASPYCDSEATVLHTLLTPGASLRTAHGLVGALRTILETVRASEGRRAALQSATLAHTSPAGIQRNEAGTKVTQLTVGQQQSCCTII